MACLLRTRPSPTLLLAERMAFPDVGEDCARDGHGRPESGLPGRHRTARSVCEGPATMIEFANVSRRYANGQFGLQDINFRLPSGRMAFLTGHSGAGKSTLLRLIP